MFQIKSEHNLWQRGPFLNVLALFLFLISFPNRGPLREILSGYTDSIGETLQCSNLTYNSQEELHECCMGEAVTERDPSSGGAPQGACQPAFPWRSRPRKRCSQFPEEHLPRSQTLPLLQISLYNILSTLLLSL